ncbi:MAG: YciI family protein [Verrucomicrobiales bacterium]
MNTPTNTSEYLLLFRGTHWDKNLSPEEIQKAMGQFMAWFERLTQQGKLKTGQPLANEGKIVSGRSGRTVADGPFVESKEAIGGYFLLQVADLDEAVAIAQGCPILEYGSSVEVRPVAQQCPTMQRVNQELAHAVA